jgi:hypothetical protein
MVKFHVQFEVECLEMIRFPETLKFLTPTGYPDYYVPWDATIVMIEKFEPAYYYQIYSNLNDPDHPTLVWHYVEPNKSLWAKWKGAES